MFLTPVTADVVRPRYVLCGLPKSGLHLLVGMVQAICEPMPGHLLHPGGSWWGTFDDHSFSSRWGSIERQLRIVSYLQPGKFFKGHVGYRDEIERFLYYFGASFVFIYRDPRDVAVSQAHHARSTDGERFKHSAHAAYQAMTFDDALAAVITGMGPYTGVMERWELYAPWLDVEWVQSIKFEHAVSLTNRAETAQLVLEYGIDRTVHQFGVELKVDQAKHAEAIAAMTEASQNTDASATFRKGTSGQWREVFTEEHKRLFKASDRNGWLVKLGYETSEDW